MALLSLANVTYALGDRVLLDGINLTLQEGQHVGMVGRNGCGKSTLLKIIAGVGGLKPDSGQVQLARGATVGYLTQDPVLDFSRTLRDEARSALAHVDELAAEMERLAHRMGEVEGDELQQVLDRYAHVERRLQAVGGTEVDHRVEATLHGVGLTDDLFDVPVAGLSGGQKGRLALAKLLLAQPDVLLLDEPTNHLDIAGRQWLEEFLADYDGAVLLVSHDRWMLDRCVSRIVEMHDGELEEYPGNFAAYLEQRAQRRLTQAREYQKQQEMIQREQAFIDRYRAGQRARQAQGRLKRLERFKRDEAMERPLESQNVNIRIAAGSRPGDIVLSAENLTQCYGQRVLFRDFTFTLKRGERLGVIGPNGSGKSTLIHCLLGLTKPTAGKARLGAGVDVGHYRQTHEHLDLSLTVVEYLQRFVMGGSMAIGSEQAARDLAGAFLFSGDAQDKPLRALSGGERSRAVLAGLVVGGHNLLVLDEPTNHLDIPSAQRLEEALRTYTAPQEGFSQNASGGGTLVLITHDRMLLEHLADQLLIFDGQGNVRHFLGRYSDWLKTQTTATPAPAPTSDKSSKPAPTKPTPARSEASSRPPKEKSKTAPGPHARLNQEQLEKKIIAVETALTDIDRQLADPATYRDAAKIKALQEKRDVLSAELKPLEEEWARRAEG